MPLSNRERAIHYISSWTTAVMMGANEHGVVPQQSELMRVMNQCEKIVDERCGSISQDEFWDILDEITVETSEQGGQELSDVIVAQQEKVREGKV